MTVIDETEAHKINKYDNLYFVEFLELISRIAMVGIDAKDLLEYKVYMLLEIVYNE